MGGRGIARSGNAALITPNPGDGLVPVCPRVSSGGEHAATSSRQQRVVLLSNVDRAAVPTGGGEARRQSVHAQQQYNRAHVLHRGARQSAAAPPQIARYDRRPTPDRSFAAAAAVADRPALPVSH